MEEREEEEEQKAGEDEKEEVVVSSVVTKTMSTVMKRAHSMGCCRLAVRGRMKKSRLKLGIKGCAITLYDSRILESCCSTFGHIVLHSKSGTMIVFRR